MKCPECGAEMVLRETKKFLRKDGSARKFYGCSRFPECLSAHGAHPDGKPLGFPADKETKKLRIEAHAALADKFAGFKRKEVYVRLQAIMNMTRDEAHIGKFTADQCRSLIKYLKFSTIEPDKILPDDKEENDT